MLINGGCLLMIARLSWAVLEWVSRLYVLTNRRVMRIRGVFNVEMFECPLDRIQNTEVQLSITERLVRVGTVMIETAGTWGQASWKATRGVRLHAPLEWLTGRYRPRSNGGRGADDTQ